MMRTVRSGKPCACVARGKPRTAIARAAVNVPHASPPSRHRLVIGSSLGMRYRRIAAPVLIG
jgi:hypothetical protein